MVAESGAAYTTVELYANLVPLGDDVSADTNSEMRPAS